MYKFPGLLLMSFILAMAAGCTHINSLGITQDLPEDVEILLYNQEFRRAELLLEQHPELDTPEQRKRLNEQILIYENAILAEAQAKESQHDLFSATRLLDSALHKLPESSRLAEYKHTLDMKRSERLEENERQQLLANARYIIAQQNLYHEQANLESPGLSQRLEYTLNRKKSTAISDELLKCGGIALDRNDLDTADECLQLAQTINDSPEVQEAISSLRNSREAERHVEEKKAQVKRVKKKKILAKKRKNTTQLLLTQTQKALDENNLVMARTTFQKLPDPDSEIPEIIAIRERLDNALQTRVAELVTMGDKQYRADNVGKAINSWDQALELDPDNPNIKERLERARKVLARLEELKSKQRKN